MMKHCFRERIVILNGFNEVLDQKAVINFTAFFYLEGFVFFLGIGPLKCITKPFKKLRKI